MREDKCNNVYILEEWLVYVYTFKALASKDKCTKSITFEHSND